MGLLDRWRKKKTTQQLSQVEERESKQRAAVEDRTKTAKKIKIEDKPKTIVKTAHSEVGYRILVRPLITEKAAVMESFNKYSFVVSRHANKQQIRQAISEVYGVEPKSVHIINIPGKSVRFGKNHGKRSDYKKAVITLPAGKTISIHEGV